MIFAICMAWSLAIPAWSDEGTKPKNSNENVSLEDDGSVRIDMEPPVEEETEKQENLELKPVTVRGARESRDLSRDRAASGSVLLPEDFDDAGDTMPEVLDQEAGVRVTKLGGPASFSTLSIRGSTSDQVLVVLDGVPINSAAGGPVDLSRIPLGNVERIEIYRGVSPLAFGSSPIGGAVAISTRTPRRRQLAISGGGGSFAAREARLYFAEPGESWEVGFGLFYSGWEGSFPYVNDNGTRFDASDDRRVLRSNNAYDQINLLGKARLHLGERWIVTLMEWFFWRDQGVPGLGQFETKKSRFELFDSLTSLELRGEKLGGLADWTLQAGFRATQSAFEDPLNEIGLAGNDAKDHSYAPSISTSATLEPFSWWDITGRAEYRYERFEPSESSTSAAKSDRHRVSAGMETGLTIEAIDLLILPSGHVEWTDSHMSRKETGSDPLTTDSRRAEWSWRAALVNQSIPDTKITLSGGRAVRLPSLFELFGNSGRVIGNPELQAESAMNLDAGIIYESSMLPEFCRLRLESYGFYSDVKSLIQFVQTAQNVARAENVDRARMWGLEAGLRGDFFRHLRVHGNYTFLDTENTGNLSARKGNSLPFRPASKWYARAEGYACDLPELAEVAAFVDTEWIAGNFLDNANLVAVSDRFYLNAGMSVELKHSVAKMSVTARNLTSERTSDLTGYPLPGRSFHFLLTVKVL